MFSYLARASDISVRIYASEACVRVARNARWARICDVMEMLPLLATSEEPAPGLPLIVTRLSMYVLLAI